MKSRKVLKKFSILLVVLTLFLSIPCTSYGQKLPQNEYDLNYFMQIMQYIKDNYVLDVKNEDLVQGAVKGLFYNLDEYSNYYTKDEFEKLIEDVSGDFVGIGIYVTEKDGYVTILSPIEGTPAYKAGIKAGDRIVSVDGKDAKELDSLQTIDLIKGKKGTKVKLGIQREGQKDILYFNILRDEVKMNPISYEILEGNIGYLKIAQFNEFVYDNIVSALKEMDKKHVKRIIIDVRDNPGGLLDQVVKVSNLFIPAGRIVSINYKNGMVENYDSINLNPKYKICVLVNQDSASASEIFAGAVQDRKAGTIIGDTTFGKGVVQEILSLPNGDGIKLTTAEYLTPNKRHINEVGVKPDIAVKNTKNQDLQLKKAIEIIKR